MGGVIKATSICAPTRSRAIMPAILLTKQQLRCAFVALAVRNGVAVALTTPVDVLTSAIIASTTLTGEALFSYPLWPTAAAATTPLCSRVRALPCKILRTTTPRPTRTPT